LKILESKKNRIILVQKENKFPTHQFRSILNGVLSQDRDLKTETEGDMEVVTEKSPGKDEISDMEFANKIVKHTKSNAIILAKDKQLLASGVGQTSRVDCFETGIMKAGSFGFGLKGSVMASDAFFPFADCVEIAHQAGITAVIQPGGSIRDKIRLNFVIRITWLWYSREPDILNIKIRYSISDNRISGIKYRDKALNIK